MTQIWDRFWPVTEPYGLMKPSQAKPFSADQTRPQIWVTDDPKLRKNQTTRNKT